VSHGNTYTIDDVYTLGVVRLRMAGYHPVDSPPLSPGVDGQGVPLRRRGWEPDPSLEPVGR